MSTTASFVVPEKVTISYIELSADAIASNINPDDAELRKSKIIRAPKEILFRMRIGNEPRLAPSYPRQPGQYDALFVPRSTHFCGQLAVHDAFKFVR